MLNNIKLNESQALWLAGISENDLGSFFQVARHTRLLALDNAQVDLKQGGDIQNEIAALHRLEKMFLTLRAKIVESENKQEK